ncbi:hypothetical protein [Pseudoruegeria sp. HB172150]|uniref:hypothetical protein n=1 Tax=Pseudoruegeria sp. HB172150 TaxID=2721164 RepID=UPI00155752EB|nr:hypothetical protein [Pseudoruegeria sp. HB172150]
MNDGLKTLARLAGLIRDRELTRLNKLSEQRRKAESELSVSREARMRALSQAAPDPAHIAGSVEDWLRLNAAETGRLSRAVSQAAAQAEGQGVVARRAFGRADALERLARRKGR